jgi:hypothetical protein
VLAFASQLLLVASLVAPAALLAFAPVTAAYLARIRSLLRVMADKEGALFAARGALAHYALCGPVVLGAVWGKLRSLGPT